WAAITAGFCAKRLRGTQLTASHVAEMIVTSIAIPPVSLYWRMRGALHFRVMFL
ncbi:glycosyltransferase family 2 protein, partial [Burkholderia sola]|nr:glycosyltransferase family 2 protein [Burkholderia sola]